MESLPHEKYIRRAIALAQQAVDKKTGHPFGALLVDPTQGEEGTIVLEIENTVVKDHDATRHAELNLISHGCRTFSKEEMKRFVLYTSTEPCAMCSGSIYWGGVRQVVYGLPEERLMEIVEAEQTSAEAVDDGKLNVPCRQIFDKAGAEFHVVGPILEEEATKPHLGYWSTLS